MAQGGGLLRRGAFMVPTKVEEGKACLSPLANAIVWLVVALQSTGDVAPAVHNFGCENNPF
jgi:hypothetical protein